MSMLPDYAPSTSVPFYSSIPLPGEARIEYTPRPGTPGSLGNFTKSWKHAIIILTDQNVASHRPSYGQHSNVNGELHILSPKNTIRVVLKLEGRLDLSIEDGTSSTSSIFSERVTLWCQDSKGSNLPYTACPSALPFHIKFPPTFMNENRAYKLPPSFEAVFYTIPTLTARCTYSLRLTITTGRQYGPATWKTSKSYWLALDYRPRAHARPRFIPSDSIFSTVKTQPEEWLQINSKMCVRPNSQVEPIDCHLLLPSAPAFALAETIPFHIQLHGSLSSLRELLPPTTPILVPQPALGSRQRGYPMTRILPIRVFIVRQVVVEIDGRRSFRTFVIGYGRIWPIPPPITDPKGVSEVSVEWEGEVRCGDSVIAPGFNIGNVLVKDYIMLVLTPPNARTSSLQALEVVHPIRLVTDPWLDVGTLHPQDI